MKTLQMKGCVINSQHVTHIHATSVGYMQVHTVDGDKISVSPPSGTTDDEVLSSLGQFLGDSWRRVGPYLINTEYFVYASQTRPKVISVKMKGCDMFRISDPNGDLLKGLT